MRRATMMVGVSSPISRRCVKVAEVAPAATATDSGTLSEALLLPRVTLDPPAGPFWVSVTVQMPVALCPRLAGLQAPPETSTGASRPTVTV